MPTPPYADPIPSILSCGFLNLLAGASGIGKTALIAGMLRRFREGGSLLGHTVTPPPAVGYVVADRPWRDSKLWFDAAGAPDVPHYSVLDDLSFATHQFRAVYKGPDLLMAALDRLDMPPGALIVVDPVALFLGGNLLDYRAVAMACIDIHRALIKAQYCLIGICHTAKLKADKADRYLRPQDRILGTGALLGFTATQMYFMGPDEAGDPDGLYTFLWNPHHAPQETFKLARDPQSGLFLIDGPGAVSPADGASPKQAAISAEMSAVLSTVPPYPHGISMASLVQVHQDVGTRATLWRRLKRLETLGLVAQTSGRLWYRPSAELPTVADTGESPG